MVYIGKNYSYRYYNEIKNKKWYRNRFRLFRKPSIKKDRDENSTYIPRKCNQYRTCLQFGFICEKCFKDYPYYSKDEFNRLVKDKHINIDVLSNFVDIKSPIKCRCKKCKYIFDKFPKDLLKEVKCPNCRSSCGEQLIVSYLDKEKIKYIKEKRFPDLKCVKPLRFDFYLPEYNAIIEYDGLQHFKPVKFHAKTWEEAVENFNQLKVRDKQKNEYCRDNNIPLLRIKYDNNNVISTVEKFIASVKQCKNHSE